MYVMSEVHHGKKNARTSCMFHVDTPYDSDQLYIANLGYAPGISIFLIFAPKHRLWVLVRTASPRRF